MPPGILGRLAEEMRRHQVCYSRETRVTTGTTHNLRPWTGTGITAIYMSVDNPEATVWFSGTDTPLRYRRGETVAVPLEQMLAEARSLPSVCVDDKPNTWPFPDTMVVDGQEYVRWAPFVPFYPRQAAKAVLKTKVPGIVFFETIHVGHASPLLAMVREMRHRDLWITVKGWPDTHLCVREASEPDDEIDPARGHG